MSSVDRQQTIDREIKALKQTLQAEREAYVVGQMKERGALHQRQAAENQQLSATVEHRVTEDRAREQQARRAHVSEYEHNREIEQECTA